MKKQIKLVTILSAVIILSLLTLTGCNRTPSQDALGAYWNSENIEQFEYDVTVNKKGEPKKTGTLTTTFQKLNDKDITIGEEKIKKANGHLYTSKLVINDSKDYIESQVWFVGVKDEKLMVPVKAYRKEFKNNALTIIKGNYSGRNYNYTINKDGKVSKNVLDLGKKAYFDNDQLYAILRSVDFDQQIKFECFTPFPTENKVKKIGASSAKTEKMKVEFNDYKNKPDKEKEIDVHVMALVVNEKPAGVPQTLYFAKDEIKVDEIKDGKKVNELLVKNALVKITAGNETVGQAVYVLKKITII